MDGGLMDAVESTIVALKATDLTGFAGLGEDFKSGDGGGDAPRLVVSQPQNVAGERTCQKRFRRVTILFSVYESKKETLKTSTDKLVAVFKRWQETMAREITMPVGVVIRGFEVLDANRAHERTGLWSERFATQWLIETSRT